MSSIPRLLDDYTDAVEVNEDDIAEVGDARAAGGKRIIATQANKPKLFYTVGAFLAA